MTEVTKQFLAAKAILRNPEGKFLILREASYEEGTNTGKWDVPGGRLKIGETMIDGLQREVMEECGLAVRVVRLLDAKETFNIIKGEKVHIVRLYYLCEADNSEVVLSEEHDLHEWIGDGEVSSREVLSDANLLMRSVIEAGT